MRIAFLLVLLFCSAGAFAEVYKCKQDARTIYSQHPCSEDATVIGSKLTVSLDSASPPPSKPIGSASLVLSSDGVGYRVSGAVKGVPVRFHVDTGATTTSISSAVATKAGIYECHHRMFSTANGMIQGCVATASEITFGNFRVMNVEVVVMPFMSGDSLLGLNVLRLFRVEQQPGGVMKISMP